MQLSLQFEFSSNVRLQIVQKQNQMPNESLQWILNNTWQQKVFLITLSVVSNSKNNFRVNKRKFLMTWNFLRHRTSLSIRWFSLKNRPGNCWAWKVNKRRKNADIRKSQKKWNELEKKMMKSACNFSIFLVRVKKTFRCVCILQVEPPKLESSDKCFFVLFVLSMAKQRHTHWMTKSSISRFFCVIRQSALTSISVEF